jgi:hypothetical protein
MDLARDPLGDENPEESEDRKRNSNIGQIWNAFGGDRVLHRENSLISTGEREQALRAQDPAHLQPGDAPFLYQGLAIDVRQRRGERMLLVVHHRQVLGAPAAMAGGSHAVGKDGVVAP